MKKFLLILVAMVASLSSRAADKVEIVATGTQVQVYPSLMGAEYWSIKINDGTYDVTLIPKN